MSWPLTIVVLGLFAVGGYFLAEAKRVAPVKTRVGPSESPAEPAEIAEAAALALRLRKRASVCFVAGGLIGFLWAALNG